MSKPTIDQAKHLIDYRELLKAQVKDLRARACLVAAKVRELDQLLEPEIIQAVEEQKAVDEQYTIKTPDQLKDLLKN